MRARLRAQPMTSLVCYWGPGSVCDQFSAQCVRDQGSMGHQGQGSGRTPLVASQAWVGCRGLEPGPGSSGRWG